MHEDRPVTVWDLPTRIFHWALAILIALQFASGEFDLLSMDWHYRLGYATLALILFRIAWGFAGSRTSRFADFVRGPAAIARYTVDLLRGRATHAAGHNPLGGWSVLLMLASVAVQCVTGLFSSDDIDEAGPLTGRVADGTVDWMTRVHHLNSNLLLLLIALHLVAILLHWLLRHDNLVAPMWHGRRRVAEAEPPMRPAPLWRALVLAALAALAVTLLVAWGEAA